MAAIERAVAELEPGGRLLRMRTLTGGVSADVIGLSIATSDGKARRVVFRRPRDLSFKAHGTEVTAKEYRLLVALHRLGFAVPEPYLHGPTESVGGPYLLMEWVDGSTELTDRELPAGLDQMARFLVELHRLDPLRLPFNDGLETIEDPRVAIERYVPNSEIGRHVAAGLAAGDSAPAVSRPALLHGDYWPGNVLWQDGRLAAIIDWEDACLGDPLADLATARLELLCRYGGDAMERFTSKYLAFHRQAGRPMRVDQLSLWELYVSASALAVMGDWGLKPSEEARRRERTGAFFDRAARELVRSEFNAHSTR